MLAIIVSIPNVMIAVLCSYLWPCQFNVWTNFPTATVEPTPTKFGKHIG